MSCWRWQNSLSTSGVPVSLLSVLRCMHASEPWALQSCCGTLECFTLDIKGAAPSPSWCGQLARDPGILPAGALSGLQSHRNDNNIGFGVRTSYAHLFTECPRFPPLWITIGPVWSIPDGDRMVAAGRQRNAILPSLHSSPLKCCARLWQKAGCRSPADVSLWG